MASIDLFAIEGIEHDDSATVRACDLYAAYRRFCEAHDYRAATIAYFGTRIGRRWLEKRYMSRGVMYPGVRVLAEWASGPLPPLRGRPRKRRLSPGLGAR